jgi:hypothetical protein
MSKRMLQRKRGGQPGNTNAVTHGRNSAATRAARAAEFEARRAKERQYWIDNPPPKTDYAAICAGLRVLRDKQDVIRL